MSEKNLSFEQQVEALAVEDSNYNAMRGTPGWKAFEAEIQLYLAENIEANCRPHTWDTALQNAGRIDAIRWLLGHFNRVKDRLVELQELHKDETTQS